MKDPATFVKAVPIGTAGVLQDDEHAPPTGKCDFDLDYPTPTQLEGPGVPNANVKGLVLLKLYNKNSEAPIRGYWLPWQKGGTTQITLGDEADYFFTSTLGGCRIQLAGNKVLHIAGDTGTAKWRENQAKKVLGDEYPRSRAYSEPQYGEFGFFMGYRKGGIWTFLLQKKLNDMRTGEWKLDTQDALGGVIEV